MFLAFEGGEGAGKSTQVRLLAEQLRTSGRTVTVTREPGGTPAAERMRALLLDPELASLDARAEALLFAAARADHAASVIRPALDRGHVVITDRYIDSSLAYQGIARDLGVQDVEHLSLWATGGLLPQLTFVLDIDPEHGLVRAGEHDRLEREPLEWHRRVRGAFLELAAREPDRYCVMDATAAVEEIAARVAAAVEALSAR